MMISKLLSLSDKELQNIIINSSDFITKLCIYIIVYKIKTIS